MFSGTSQQTGSLRPHPHAGNMQERARDVYMGGNDALYRFSMESWPGNYSTLMFRIKYMSS